MPGHSLAQRQKEIAPGGRARHGRPLRDGRACHPDHPHVLSLGTQVGIDDREGRMVVPLGQRVGGQDAPLISADVAWRKNMGLTSLELHQSALCPLGQQRPRAACDSCGHQQAKQHHECEAHPLWAVRHPTASAQAPCSQPRS